LLLLLQTQTEACKFLDPGAHTRAARELEKCKCSADYHSLGEAVEAAARKGWWLVYRARARAHSRGNYSERRGIPFELLMT
jgi:hypothetical protein